jgi:glycosyltransferase involved in cell wall biosynthesis
MAKCSINLASTEGILPDLGNILTMSVVIPCYNGSATIRQCLTALGDQTISLDEYEVIVVDSSDDATPTIIKSEFPWVRLLRRDERVPVGAARNLGVQVARGDIIAFTDSDCIVAPDWLWQLRSVYLDRPDVIGVGGAICNGNPGVFFGWIAFLAEFAAWLPVGSIREVQGIVGANSSFRRWAFEKYGGNHSYDVAGDDTLFNWTLVRSGETLLFNPEARLSHLNRGDLLGVLRHLHHLGKGVAWVWLHYKIPSEFLSRSRLLGPLFAPVRTVRVIWRTLLGAPKDSWRLLLLWPFILLGFFYFGLGEVKAFSDFRSNSDKSRIEPFTSPTSGTMESG